MESTVNTYAVYGLTVDSDLKLPELRPTGADITSDVKVRRAPLDPASETDLEPESQHINATPEACRITYDSVGTFLVESGSRIQYDPFSPGKEDTKIFRRLLENQAMTVLLLQRGLLVLHASAVSVGGRAVVFLGSQGAGKSTTTAAFHSHGHEMVADDVVAIRTNGDMPVVVPSVPQIRLRTEAASALEVDNTIEYDIDWGPKKVYYPVENQSPAVPLGEFYTLHDSETVTLSAHDGTTAFFELVTNTYAQGLLSDTGTTTDHFEQCSHLLRRASVRRLTRPKRYDLLPEVVNAVVEATRARSKSTSEADTRPNAGD